MSYQGKLLKPIPTRPARLMTYHYCWCLWEIIILIIFRELAGALRWWPIGSWPVSLGQLWRMSFMGMEVVGASLVKSGNVRVAWRQLTKRDGQEWKHKGPPLGKLPILWPFLLFVAARLVIWRRKSPSVSVAGGCWLGFHPWSESFWHWVIVEQWPPHYSVRGWALGHCTRLIGVWPCKLPRPHFSVFAGVSSLPHRVLTPRLFFLSFQHFQIHH